MLCTISTHIPLESLSPHLSADVWVDMVLTSSVPSNSRQKARATVIPPISARCLNTLTIPTVRFPHWFSYWDRTVQTWSGVRWAAFLHYVPAATTQRVGSYGLQFVNMWNKRELKLQFVARIHEHEHEHEHVLVLFLKYIVQHESGLARCEFTSIVWVGGKYRATSSKLICSF